MNKLLSSFTLLCILLFSACTTSRFAKSSVTPQEISDLQLFPTYSYISMIEKGNQSKLNDSISRKAEQLLHQILIENKGQIPFTGEINIPKESSTASKIKQELETLFVTAAKQKDIAKIGLTTTIDSLLEQSGKRFGLITVSSGFTRKKSNYGKQVAKGAAVGLLTLGMYYQVPIKANSNVYTMIVDAKDNNIAFYQKSIIADKEPLDEVVLRKQIKKLYEGYFYPKK